MCLKLECKKKFGPDSTRNKFWQFIDADKCCGTSVGMIYSFASSPYLQEIRARAFVGVGT